MDFDKRQKIRKTMVAALNIQIIIDKLYPKIEIIENEMKEHKDEWEGRKAAIKVVRKGKLKGKVEYLHNNFIDKNRLRALRTTFPNKVVSTARKYFKVMEKQAKNLRPSNFPKATVSKMKGLQSWNYLDYAKLEIMDNNLQTGLENIRAQATLVAQKVKDWEEKKSEAYQKFKEAQKVGKAQDLTEVYNNINSRNRYEVNAAIEQYIVMMDKLFLYVLTIIHKTKTDLLWKKHAADNWYRATQKKIFVQ